MHLRVYSLADITTADGKFICKSIMDGIKDCHTHQQVGWPLWECPNAKCWTTWRRVLRLVFTNGLTLRLSTMLGAWTHNAFDRWQCFLSLDNSQLFKQMNNTWLQYPSH